MNLEGLKKNIKEEKLLVVDIGTPWCQPCKAMDPIVEKVAATLKDKAHFVKVDAMESSEVASEYKVMSVPTFLIFKNGKLVDTSVGKMSENHLEERVRKHI